jgi:hypothetical protein
MGSGRVNLAGGMYAIKRGDPYRIENTLAGIGGPGEWSTDSGAAKVYLWPPEGVDPNSASLVAPKLSELIEFRGNEKARRFVRFIVLRGLKFSYVDRTRFGQPAPPAGHIGLFDTNDAAIFAVRG